MAAALLLALLAVITAAFFLLRPGKNARLSAQERLEDAGKGLDEYVIDAMLRADESTLTATETIRLTNRTGQALDRLTLRTYAGAYALEETSPAATTELSDSCYPEGFSAGGITMYGVWWNDAPVAAQFTDEAGTVLSVPVSVAPGEGGELRLRFTLSVPKCAHRFGVSDGVWRFGGALPVLAVFENGAWRKDEYGSVGAPFYTECANYSLTLTLPDGWTALSSAPLAFANGRWSGSLRAARDFAFVAGPSLSVARGTTDGVLISAAAADQKSAELALKYARSALHAYTALYGDAPYDTLSVCAMELGLSASSYSGLSMIARSEFADESKLELTIAREMARQWFGSLLGSDRPLEPWQDEGACEWALLRCTLKTYGQNAMESLRRFLVDEPMRENIPATVTPASPLSYFSDWTQFTAVARGRGAAFFSAADELLGGRMDAFLKDLCARFAFKNVSREAFEQALNEFSGVDLGPLTLDYLDTYISN